MSKYYLQKGDRCYATGVYVIWDGEKFVLDGFEGDVFYVEGGVFYDGTLVHCFEETEINEMIFKPYVEIEDD